MSNIKKDVLVSNGGFTLVELMITVAILSILAAVAIPAYSNYINRAKQSDAIIGLKAAQMAQEQFFSENNDYAGTIGILPGFSGGSTYTKGVYSLKVSDIDYVSAGTAGFEIEAVRVFDGLTDRWTISHTNINPVCDTSVSGIKGYSVFSWIFD